MTWTGPVAAETIVRHWFPCARERALLAIGCASKSVPQLRSSAALRPAVRPRLKRPVLGSAHRPAQGRASDW